MINTLGDYSGATSLKAQIHAQILRSVVTGEYPPGEILNEKALIERFGVSKSPIREALIELCNEKVLRSIPRYGYEVIRITRDEVNEILEFRVLLECGCLEQIWNSITAEDIELLQRSLSVRYHAGSEEDSIFALWQYNSEFHLTLIALTRNKYVYDVLASAMKFLQRAYSQLYWERQRSTVSFKHPERHDRILQAIQDRDLDLAKECLREDILAFSDF